ncbi:ABC-2 type transport system ATP-binding protein [Branchiibius hedensis]|uniref:ABC-2 type transport system ATP-binding protein n=1 Tax=Branchiibius hedensis TaxID=672460 RepID=A0A2Y9A1I2_9MICO|nr:ATP-binding cassette domain-containing protein [Branchiibius hedensis]PWJ27256.1 ABC-2 type transport system ATP-binding protein [Branchiibius hedensis]SSA36067.1 ABC-2 type transport system ATP-binding protein [Branchiibius hedensis]
MLELRDVSRRFGDHVAVDQVSFSVPDGAMTGFVGGNGAGKTTTMRMIMGVLAQHGGQIDWQGRAITTTDRRSFGYMPEERGLYPKQPILDQLIYLARLRGLSAQDAASRSTQLLERFDLGGRTGDKLESLSLGNQQRVQIIAALVADPTMLVLDEPFSGLDPAAVDSMAALLREFTGSGVPVLFSSHQLDLVERLCDRLVILSHGRVLAEGTADDLRATETVRHRLVLGGDAGWLRDARGVRVIDIEGNTAVLQLDSPDQADAVLREAMARGSVLEFGPIRPSLADIYRDVTAATTQTQQEVPA